jgi:predicted transcriptional regulator
MSKYLKNKKGKRLCRSLNNFRNKGKELIIFSRRLTKNLILRNEIIYNKKREIFKILFLYKYLK